MVRSKEAKIVVLLTAIGVTVLSVSCHPDWSAVGIAVGSDWDSRLLYPFFHASVIHALVNAWCLLSIVFIYDVSLWRLLTAYIVAAAAPECLLSDMPTVGLSCCCYFLLGSLIFQVRRKLWFLSCITLYIAAGFLFPAVNALIHLYGYLAGLLVGLLNAPLSCFLK